MRILLISNWFPPVVSGSSFYAQSLAQTLQARGHRVTGVTLDWGEEYKPAPDLGFPVHRLSVIRIPKLPIFYNLRLMGFAFTLQNYKRLRLLIRENRPDIIHYVNHIFDTNLLSTWLAKREGVPIVGSITTPIQHEKAWIQHLLTWLDRATVGWWGVQKWDGIVSLDQQVHDYVGSIYGRKAQARSTVIPFGVRFGSMEHYENGAVPKSQRPQILMVGHMHSFRNPVQLIRAMPHVLKEIPNARLVLAGRIDIQEPLQAARHLGLTKDQVEFLGATAHDKTLQLMKTSQVFAHWLTGPYLALSTVGMEAMLCGTPVVTDLREDLFGKGKLKNGENIILVNSKDPGSIAASLIRLLKDENLCQRIGAAGRRFVQEHLDWNRIAEQMENFYGQFLKS